MKRIVLTDEELNEQKVELKPLFGIQPETYIKYVYTFLGIALLFLFLVLPGLLKNGTYYRFSTSPQGASVYVDGMRLGATPGTYFVPRGERSISLKTPYHETSTRSVEVKGRVFGSLIFKRKKDFHSDLVFNISNEELENFHLDAAAWFQSDEGYSSQPLPPVMTSLTKGYYRSVENQSHLKDSDIRDFQLSLLRAVSQNQSYREWQESAAVYLTRGRILNPGSYLKAVAEGSRYIAGSPEVLKIQASFLSLPDVRLREAPEKDIFTPTDIIRTYQPLSGDPLQFRSVGTVSEENQTYDVYAADREITKVWYSMFLDGNPSWALPSKEKLIQQGFADDSYLEDWDSAVLPGRSQEPVRFISWYAAEEFCRWLEKEYFNSPDMTVRLPGEWEWEELARKNGLDNKDRPSQKNLGPLEAGSFLSGSLKLYDMEGNLWEWCGSSFGANDSELKGAAGIMNTELPFPDRSVRGGSWANSSGQVDYKTRGSQPAGWCTAYTGFRPLLLIKRK